MPDSCAKNSVNNPHPIFLKGARGPLFAIFHRPAAGTGRGVLIVPPFAEEMNKARRMLTLQAQALAADGFSVLLSDLYGTGDSAGDFGDADWDTWLDDLGRAAQYLRGQGIKEVTLICIRAGALLALDALGHGKLHCDRLVVWNPVLNGRQWLTQFLRLRIAAGMFGESGETVDGLKATLAETGRLEVAGYEINASLGAALDTLNLENTPLPAGLQVTWLELAGTADRPLTPVARRIVDGWRQAGATVEARVVAGDSFWATQEIATAPALLEATCDVLARPAAGRIETNADIEDTGEAAPANEIPFVFHVDDVPLVGVLHRPEAPARRGVLLVVGGPQYRVGSHRQFLLLGRHLAEAGVPVLRFDYRGMGDSGGSMRGFERVDADIRAAIDAFFGRVSGLQEVVLWGLCDAAAACSFYAGTDRRVGGLVMLNPWVRTEQGIARAYLTRYYATRLVDPDLWRKLLSGRLNLRAALGSFAGMLLSAAGFKSASVGKATDASSMSVESPEANGDKSSGSSSRPLPERVADGLRRFKGQVLLILSGRDLTAEEFRQAVAGSRRWRRLMKSPLLSQRVLEEGDHTFSRRAWRDQVAEWTRDWMQSW